MKTGTPEQLQFHALGLRAVIGHFDGGRITTDGGELLLRKTDLRIRLLGAAIVLFLFWNGRPAF